MSIKDQQLKEQIDEITGNEELSMSRKRVAVGKALREAVERLKKEGKTVAEIADLVGLEESRIRIHEQSIIWFPGIYSGRQGDYAKKVVELSDEKIVELVQTRAKEDGEWAIETGHVGGSEDIMRKMMAWVSDETNIIQALERIHAENMHTEHTVDWLCRELANASKWVGGSRGR